MPYTVGASKMRKLAAKIKSELPEGAGFTLLVFGFGEPGLCNYISNAERQSMIEGMEETVKRLKAYNNFTTPEEN